MSAISTSAYRRKLGFGREWIAAVNALDPDAAVALGEDERAVQRLVLAIVKRQGKEVAGRARRRHRPHRA